MRMGKRYNVSVSPNLSDEYKEKLEKRALDMFEAYRFTYSYLNETEKDIYAALIPLLVELVKDQHLAGIEESTEREKRIAYITSEAVRQLKLLEKSLTPEDRLRILS